MVRQASVREHHTWEDWATIVLGLIIGLTPWFVGESMTAATTANAIVLGLLVLGLGVYELVSLRRWEEVALFVCGLWVMVSPWVYGYAAAGQLRVWHIVLGALVALLALVQIWQDWSLSREDLAKHGR
jgi:hypothetical protein